MVGNRRRGGVEEALYGRAIARGAPAQAMMKRRGSSARTINPNSARCGAQS